MMNEKIEGFLEKVNMNYLYCLLSKLEAHRMNKFPTYVKQKFADKITVMAMEHVAENEVPDYTLELEEAELVAQQARAAYEDDDDTSDFGEETIDDSEKFARSIESTDISEYDSFEDVKDPFANNLDDDNDDDDILDDDDEDDDI